VSYSKLQQVITDFGLGFQGVNQLAANIIATATQMLVAHGNKAATYYQNLSNVFDFQFLGLHNGGGVPRCTMVAGVYPKPQGTVAQIVWQSNPIITSFTRISTGIYFAGVSGLPSFFAHAVAIGASTADVNLPPECQCNVDPTQGGVGVYVSTRALVAGAFTLTDMSFCLTLQGQAPP
jgi:hypothetical protein